MSYKPLKNEDSLSELFSNLADFSQISKHLLKNKDNCYEFVLWVNKCKQVNYRATIIFLKEHYDSFNAEIKDYINAYFKYYLNTLGDKKHASN